MFPLSLLTYVYCPSVPNVMRDLWRELSGFDGTSEIFLRCHALHLPHYPTHHGDYPPPRFHQLNYILVYTIVSESGLRARYSDGISIDQSTLRCLNQNLGLTAGMVILFVMKLQGKNVVRDVTPLHARLSDAVEADNVAPDTQHCFT